MTHVRSIAIATCLTALVVVAGAGGWPHGAGATAQGIVVDDGAFRISRPGGSRARDRELPDPARRQRPARRDEPANAGRAASVIEPGYRRHAWARRSRTQLEVWTTARGPPWSRPTPGRDGCRRGCRTSEATSHDRDYPMGRERLGHSRRRLGAPDVLFRSVQPIGRWIRVISPHVGAGGHFRDRRPRHGAHRRRRPVGDRDALSRSSTVRTDATSGSTRRAGCCGWKRPPGSRPFATSCRSSAEARPSGGGVPTPGPSSGSKVREGVSTAEPLLFGAKRAETRLVGRPYSPQNPPKGLPTMRSLRFVAALAISAQAVIAQQPTDKSLTLDDAIRSRARTIRTYLTSRTTCASRRATLRQAYSALLPNVSSSLSTSAINRPEPSSFPGLALGANGDTYQSTLQPRPRATASAVRRCSRRGKRGQIATRPRPTLPARPRPRARRSRISTSLRSNRRPRQTLADSLVATATGQLDLAKPR